MANVQWIKISTDIFNDEKIRVIQKMPEGDQILIIWLWLLTLAGRKNDNGYIYFTHDIPYTTEMLADIMGKDSRIIMLALNTFQSFEMIEIEKEIIKVINWGKHQNIEGLSKIKEQNRIRQAKYRHNKKIEKHQEVDKSNVTSRYSNAIEEKRKEEKRKEEKRKEEKKKEYQKKVYLTEKEYEKLISDYDKKTIDTKILDMSEYLINNKKNYIDCNLAIRKWLRKDHQDNKFKKAIEFEAMK